jgi:probable F420-dependent oxidoreductase
MLDPFVVLSAIAAATRNLRIGTGVCLVPERDPIILAKAVASIDLLSAGRFLFGVGAGWNESETANHGVEPSLRWAVMRERILAMKAIWTSDEAEYHGKFVDFDPIWCWPKPAQQPHPPVLVGGLGSNVLKRVLEYGDGWMPVAPTEGLPEFFGKVRELQGRAEEAGRGHLPVTINSWALDPAQIEGCLAAGVERYAVALPIAEDSDVMSFLKDYARLARAYSY